MASATTKDAKKYKIMEGHQKFKKNIYWKLANGREYFSKLRMNVRNIINYDVALEETSSLAVEVEFGR